MRYLLMICGDDDLEVPDDEADARPWVEEMDRRGVRVQGHRLRPAVEATSVRVRDGETLLTDGPFAETREQVGGFDIIECADLDEAIEIAGRHPVARFGTVEVRAFWDQ